ncbi:hypothetical protein NDU88_005829 [Pleurodeles waltl]|uniref:Uncharacterized protein n=1 Tax=Pleurodeles waltl TaxID=8319 RepID=A0AAV7QJD6_PLEWA|nr:hypothetical protein NDU88_005829 [Pleurodeles waltl]
MLYRLCSTWAKSHQQIILARLSTTPNLPPLSTVLYLGLRDPSAADQSSLHPPQGTTPAQAFATPISVAAPPAQPDLHPILRPEAVRHPGHDYSSAGRPLRLIT